jgi:hypothetical protein
MIFLNAAFTQHFAPEALSNEVRTALGKPLRRAAALTQLALLGAFAALPAERRRLPTVLLWQSTTGPRQETLTLLDEVCNGPSEPMPYDFLATQPALAAAQIQPFLPGLQSASHMPLDNGNAANWWLLLTLAGEWLRTGRYVQALCAQLDHQPEMASGHWLSLSTAATPGTLASVAPLATAPGATLADLPDLPARLNDWLGHAGPATCHLESPAAPGQTVEFARL